MKDIEVSIADAENICDSAKVEQGYVPDDHVAMALVRAVNAACTQLGIETPGALFAQASSHETAALRATLGGLTEQSAMITQALADAGFPGRVSTGSMLTAIADLRHQGRMAGALDDYFPEALADARKSYEAAEVVRRDLGPHNSAGVPNPPDPDQVTVLLAAVISLGHLLYRLRRINPEPVANADGSTTVTLTEAVEIGTPETAPEATP